MSETRDVAFLLGRAAICNVHRYGSEFCNKCNGTGYYKMSKVEKLFRWIFQQRFYKWKDMVCHWHCKCSYLLTLNEAMKPLNFRWEQE